MADTPVKVNRHVTFWKSGSRKPRPATITAVGSTNGGVILRVGHHGEVYGNATTGILRQTTSNGTNVWTIA